MSRQYLYYRFAHLEGGHTGIEFSAVVDEFKVGDLVPTQWGWRRVIKITRHRDDITPTEPHDV